MTPEKLNRNVVFDFQAIPEIIDQPSYKKIVERLTDQEVYDIIEKWDDPTISPDITPDDARYILQHAMEQDPEQFETVFLANFVKMQS